MVDSELAVWSAKQGDTWVRSFTLASTSDTYTLNTLLVQLWSVETTTSDPVPVALIATNEADPDAGVETITTTGTSFTGSSRTLALSIPIAADLDPGGNYVLEAQWNVNGAPLTKLTHPFTVLRQYAVAQ